MKLSVVIPCYNEGETIPLLLERYNNIFSEREDIEVILVNDGSKDTTKEVLEKEKGKYPFLKVIHVEPNSGYGNAVYVGLQNATGEYIGWTHGDMQTPPEDIVKALNLFEESKDKNLYIKGRRLRRPLTDSFFTFGMSIFESVLFGYILYDINAQPNVFPRKFLDKWETPPKDFSLDLYAFLLAKINKMNVIRFPVVFGKRLAGISSWNINWKSKVKFIKRTIDFSIKLKRENRL